jgi:hypothetical protein
MHRCIAEAVLPRLAGLTSLTCKHMKQQAKVIPARLLLYRSCGMVWHNGAVSSDTHTNDERARRAVRSTMIAEGALQHSDSAKPMSKAANDCW